MAYYIAMGMAVIAELLLIGLIVWLIAGKKIIKRYTVIEVTVVDEEDDEPIYV